jgi:DNA-directed RNA polymerase subunit RPC12/RpoP
MNDEPKVQWKCNACGAHNRSTVQKRDTEYLCPTCGKKQRLMVSPGSADDMMKD